MVAVTVDDGTTEEWCSTRRMIKTKISCYCLCFFPGMTTLKTMTMLWNRKFIKEAYFRSKLNQYPITSLIQIEGVNTKEVVQRSPYSNKKLPSYLQGCRYWEIRNVVEFLMPSGLIAYITFLAIIEVVIPHSL